MSKLSRPYEDVVLYQGDDLARVHEFSQRLRRAGGEQLLATGRMDDEDVPDVAVIAREYDEFIPGATDRGVTVRVEAMPGRRFRELVADHPPREARKDDDGKVLESWPGDEEHGFNVDTIAEPLVKACVDEREDFIDDLSDGNFSRLFAAAVRVNEVSGPDPKARLSSLFDPTSGETSESPERMD